MVRHLATPLGIGLLIAGLSLIASPRVAILLFLGVGILVALVLAAARRRRLGRAVDRTPAEELASWQKFTARRRRSAPLESACYILVAGAFIWLDGLTLGTILIAAGIGILLYARWFVEPRTWAEVARRLAAPRT